MASITEVFLRETSRRTWAASRQRFIAPLELRSQRLLRLQRLANLFHSLLPFPAVRLDALLIQDLTDEFHDLLHLSVVHGIQRFKDGKFPYSFHVRSGG